MDGLKKLIEQVTHLPEALFLLHFNVDDIVPNSGNDPDREDASLPEYLLTLFPEKQIVLRYNPSSGIQFAHPHMKALFLECLDFASSFTEEEKKAIESMGAQVNDEVTLSKEPHLVLEWLETVMHRMKDRGGVAVIIDHAEFLCPADGFGSRYDRNNILTIKRWNLDRQTRSSRSKVILLTSNLNSIHESIRRLCRGPRTLEIPLPGMEDRINYLRAKSFFKSTDDVDRVARLTSGMKYYDINSIASLMKWSDGKEAEAVVWNYKKKLIADESAGLIEVLEPEYGLDAIGGLKPVKQYFVEVIQALQEGLYNLVPMGITLIGPPGTGKTALVKSLAYECGFACLRLVNIRERWVGESERNYWQALRLIRAMAPVIVLEDEADQSEQSRDEYVGDSGVSNRIRQMRFEFTSDPAIRGKVLWIRVTNRPDKLDIAEKRSGRSSERIPICFPDPEEMVSIVQALIKKHRFQVKMGNVAEFMEDLGARRNECISGADLEEILIRAYQQSWRLGKTAIDRDDWNWALEDFIPLLSTEELKRMEELAVAECSSRRFLPARFRGGGKIQ